MEELALGWAENTRGLHRDRVDWARSIRAMGAMAALATAAGLAGCGGGSNEPAVEAESFVARPASAASAVVVGQSLFKDKSLSASGQMACATCHDEALGHADKPGTHLPIGGPGMNLSGMRSSPTTRYLNEGHAFRLDASGKPFGGFNWDGRIDSRREQAKGPFFDAVEMADLLAFLGTLEDADQTEPLR